MLLRLAGITRRIGERTLFQELDLEVRAGDRIGLIGPNGAGKSTLLRVAAGDEPGDAGRREVGRGVRVGMLRQEIDPTLTRPAREETARVFAELDALEQELRSLETEMTRHGADGSEVPARLAARYDRVRASFERGGGFERAARVERVLAGLGFSEVERARPVREFSGGWRMRIELAKLLLAGPDVLLLDEPTNHLDLPAIQWFEEFLQGFRGALVVVSHDRTFLRRHATRMLELDGRGGADLYEGGFEAFLAARERLRAERAARRRNQERRVAEMERFVDRFRAKASKARQVQSRIKMLERMERVAPERAGPRRMRLRIPAPPRSGRLVLALEAARKSYGERLVYDGIDFALERGERVALVGPNGAGKSTLLRLLAGVLPLDGGKRRLGHRVELAFFAQHQLDALDPQRSVLEQLAAGARDEDVPRLRGHLGAFLFPGEEVDKPVAILSGGEKSRLALAALLLRPRNLLLLDEPTNHLDLQACEVLEAALAAYRGTLVLVSHDRTLINALATRVVEVRDGQLRSFPGNYDDYLRQSAARGGDVAPAPAGTPERPRRPARNGREQRRARERASRRVARLEDQILERERALEALAWRLGNPQVHRDGEQVRALEAERATLRDKVAELYAEWERLAEELDALGEDPNTSPASG